MEKKRLLCLATLLLASFHNKPFTLLQFLNLSHAHDKSVLKAYYAKYVFAPTIYSHMYVWFKLKKIFKKKSNKDLTLDLRDASISC